MLKNGDGQWCAWQVYRIAISLANKISWPARFVHPRNLELAGGCITVLCTRLVCPVGGLVLKARGANKLSELLLSLLGHGIWEIIMQTSKWANDTGSLCLWWRFNGASTCWAFTWCLMLLISPCEITVPKKSITMLLCLHYWSLVVS